MPAVRGIDVAKRIRGGAERQVAPDVHLPQQRFGPDRRRGRALRIVDDEARPHPQRDAGARHRQLELVRLVVAFARLRLEAEQVVRRDRVGDASEHAGALAGDAEHLAAGDAGEILQPGQPLHVVLRRARRLIAHGRVEERLVRLDHEHLHARARHRPRDDRQIEVRVGESHERAGDEQHRRRRFDAGQAVQHVGDGLERVPREQFLLARQRQRLLDDAGPAEGVLGRELALAIDELLREHLVRIGELGEHGQRFRQADVGDRAAAHAFADEALERVARPRVVRREVDFDAAVRQRDDADAIGRLQLVDERARRRRTSTLP